MSDYICMNHALLKCWRRQPHVLPINATLCLLDAILSTALQNSGICKHSFYHKWCPLRGGRYPLWFNSMFEFNQKRIHSIFDSILLYPRFNSKYYSIPKKSADSIQKMIQFNSQGIRILVEKEKSPKIAQKVSKIDKKRELFIKNGKYRFKIWFIHSFHNKIQFKWLFNINFLGIFNSKNYSTIFFPG